MLRGAAVTADRYAVGTVVCVQDPDMKQAWCLAASGTNATAEQLTGYYGRRWVRLPPPQIRLEEILAALFFTGSATRRGMTHASAYRPPRTFEYLATTAFRPKAEALSALLRTGMQRRQSSTRPMARKRSAIQICSGTHTPTKS